MRFRCLSDQRLRPLTNGSLSSPTCFRCLSDQRLRPPTSAPTASTRCFRCLSDQRLRPHRRPGRGRLVMVSDACQIKDLDHRRKVDVTLTEFVLEDLVPVGELSNGRTATVLSKADRAPVLVVKTERCPTCSWVSTIIRIFSTVLGAKRTLSMRNVFC